MEPFVHWESWLVWSAVATSILTVLAEGAQGLGQTRMSLPYLLGTMVTPDRDRARLVGVGMHLVSGLVFAFLYIAAFHAWGGATILRGLALSSIHAGLVLTVGVRVLPALHPRMASEHQQPTEVRRLEPPGFLAMHYGVRTPIVIALSHLVFGAVLGGFYSE